MSRIPGPSQIRSGIRHLRDLKRGGGPERVRLKGISRPEGNVFPTSTAEVEIETRLGGTIRMSPEIPVPFPYAWGYRAARKLGLPLVSQIEPRDIQMSVPVPGWAWPGRD